MDALSKGASGQNGSGRGCCCEALREQSTSSRIGHGTPKEHAMATEHVTPETHPAPVFMPPPESTTFDQPGRTVLIDEDELRAREEAVSAREEQIRKWIA